MSRSIPIHVGALSIDESKLSDAIENLWRALPRVAGVDPLSNPWIKEMGLDEWLARYFNHAMPNGNTAMHVLAKRPPACSAESLAGLIRTMAFLGCSIDGRNIGGRTALHSACYCNLGYVAEGLLLAGASPSVLDSGGDSPLDDAASSGCMEACVALLAAGADPSGSSGREAPWNRAQTRGHGGVASFLLQAVERGALMELSHASSGASRGRLRI